MIQNDSLVVMDLMAFFVLSHICGLNHTSLSPTIYLSKEKEQQFLSSNKASRFDSHLHHKLIGILIKW